MRVHFLFLVALLITSACSSPKYTASFSSYNQAPQYTASKNNTVKVSQSESSTPQEVVLASASSAPVKSSSSVSKLIEYSSFKSDKIERREVVKQLSHELKTYTKQQKEMARAGTYQSIEWDNDLKLAAIFGAAGLVGVLLGGLSGVFYVIGGIALIIGVIFFVQWVIRQ